MDQPVQILSYHRVKSNSTFTVSLQHGDGTTIPVYEVLVSNLEPNLTVSRLQSVYSPPQQLPPPPPTLPSQHGYPYAPPAPPNPYPYHQQQQQQQQQQQHYSHQISYPYTPSYQHQPQQYPQYQTPTPPQQTKTTIGTITLSSMSSKITFSIHNQTDLKMKRPDFLSSSHQFTHPRFGKLSWKESDLHDKKYKLLDSNKTVLARFDKLKTADQQAKSSLWGSSSKKGKSWAFSIFVNADPEFLDWIVVSGLGVVEYRIKSDREWEQALIDAVDDGFG